MLLAVTVRNVYQIGSPRPAPAVRFGRAPKDASWLEGWLWREGKWTAATKIQELIGKQFDSFVKGFTVQTPGTGTGLFDLQSDGKHVWAAYNGKVYVFSSAGKVASWDMPRPDEGWPPQWWPVNLICLGGGKAWCVRPARRRVDVTSLALSKGKIKAKELPAAGVTTTDRFYVMKDGRLWRWNTPNRYGHATGGAFLWKDGKWQEQKPRALLTVFFEDGDGGVWFSPKRGREKGTALSMVGKDGRMELTWPKYVPTGVITRAGKDLLLAACGSYVVSIVPAGADKPDQWKAGRVHLLVGAVEHQGVFLDGKGNIVGAGGWTGKFRAEAGRAK